VVVASWLEVLILRGHKRGQLGCHHVEQGLQAEGKKKKLHSAATNRLMCPNNGSNTKSVTAMGIPG